MAGFWQRENINHKEPQGALISGKRPGFFRLFKEDLRINTRKWRVFSMGGYAITPGPPLLPVGRG
jgi:hypothetical protein